MSRGRGRGRGAGPRPGGPMANNMGELAELTIRTAPSPLYPEMEVPRAGVLTECERLQVRMYKEIRQALSQESPFYVLSVAAVTGDTNADGIARYSDRWKPKRKAAQSLADLHTDERFFPDELLPVLRGEAGTGRRKRRQRVFDLDTFLDMTMEGPAGGPKPEGEDEERANRPLGDGEDEDEGEEREEDGDDDFGDEDDNDYAENYFDNGEGEGDEGGGGAGADGDDWD